MTGSRGFLLALASAIFTPLVLALLSFLQP
jgi:hypothetical protein